MLIGTHFVVGVATALAITQPQTLPEIITAVTAGAVGGIIADIDAGDSDRQRKAQNRRERVIGAVIGTGIILALLVADLILGAGMWQYVTNNFGLRVIGGIVGFAALLAVGRRTEHRAFTHSLLALALFGGMVQLFCRPAALPFLLGYASHLVLDFFNVRGMQLFFPLGKRVSLGLCRAHDKPNSVLFWAALAVDVVMCAVLVVL